MDKKAKQKEAEKIEAERMSVEALKNTFKDIKAVEIEKSNYDNMTGTYSIFVIMTNQSGDSVKFSYGYNKNEPEELNGYIIEDKRVQTKGNTTNTVQVTYSNKEEDEF